MLPENFNSIALLGKESGKVDSLLKVILGKDIEKNDFTDSDLINLTYNFQIKAKRFTIQKINIQELPEESIRIYNNSNILIAYFSLDNPQQFDTIIKNHIFMANTFGVKNAIVILDSGNMLETTNFIKIKSRIHELFKNRNFKLQDINFIEHRGNNDVLKEKINGCLLPENKRNRNKLKKQELLLSINNVFKVDKNHLGINGKIISGELNVNEDVYICPINQKCKVLEIQKMHKTIPTAKVGDDIGFMIKSKNNFVSPGMIVTSNLDAVKPTRNIHVQLINLNGKLISRDQSYILLCHNLETIGTINQITLNNKQTTKMNVDNMVLGEKGILNVSFRESIIVTPYLMNQNLASVALLDKNTRELIGIGLVKSVKYK